MKFSVLNFVFDDDILVNSFYFIRLTEFREVEKSFDSCRLNLKRCVILSKCLKHAI